MRVASRSGGVFSLATTTRTCRLRLVDLLPKLTCGKPKGCGSTDMVLFSWKEKPSKAKLKVKEPPAAELPF